MTNTYYRNDDNLISFRVESFYRNGTPNQDQGWRLHQLKQCPYCNHYVYISDFSQSHIYCDRCWELIQFNRSMWNLLCFKCHRFVFRFDYSPHNQIYYCNHPKMSHIYGYNDFNNFRDYPIPSSCRYFIPSKEYLEWIDEHPFSTPSITLSNNRSIFL